MSDSHCEDLPPLKTKLLILSSKTTNVTCYISDPKGITREETISITKSYRKAFPDPESL